MELIYKNKKDEKEILKKAENLKRDIYIPENKSLLFKGDNFDAMSLLLDKFSGKVDLIYIDPPYNTSQDYFLSPDRANSVSFSKDSVIAYSDRMSQDEYLEFIRQRLILMRLLMSEEASIYLHIDCKIGHYVKMIMDEVFGMKNFKNDITRIKSNPKNFYRRAYGNEKDMILFYAKNNGKNIWNDIRVPLENDELIRRFSKIDENGRRYTTIPLHAPGETLSGPTGQPWRDIPVPKGRHWRTDPKEFDILDEQGRIEWSSTGNPRIKKYADEHKGKKVQDVWRFKDPQNPVYPTEKNSQMLDQIIAQSSKEDSIVMDCFAGSGTALKSAYKLGRRWIGIDSSGAAIEAIRKRQIGEYAFLDIEGSAE